MIKAKKIFKTYYNKEIETPVLKGVDLEVKEGEYIIINGRSGAGKSTLLYQLGLLDTPTSGEIYINDFDVNKLTLKEKSLFRLNYLGYVFQDYALVPELTALENVIISLLMQGVDKRKALKKTFQVLDQVGLKGKEDNLPSQLSGGEQQRVGIARAIVNRPKIVFADEPTASLDSQTADRVMDVFLDLHKQGQTIVMISHEEKYHDHGDKMIHISDGKIV